MKLNSKNFTREMILEKRRLGNSNEFYFIYVSVFISLSVLLFSWEKNSLNFELKHFELWKFLKYLVGSFTTARTVIYGVYVVSF